MGSALHHIKALTEPVQNYVEKLQAIAARHRYIAFYGCGKIMVSLIEAWTQKAGLRIDYCCDRNPAKWQTVIKGIPCLSPDELTRIKDDMAVFITTGALLEVYDFLKQRDFPFVYPVYRYDIESLPEISRLKISVLRQKLAAAYKLLADRRSVQVFEAIVRRAYQGCDDIRLMSNVMDRDQCFPDVIHLTAHESFVDGGAFDGDTIRDFVSRVDGRFDHVYAFELTAENCHKLTDCVHMLPSAAKIHCYNLGLYDSHEEVSYSIAEDDSTIGVGSGKGVVDRLDAVLGDAPVTFIKLDIEGAEMHALRGAEHIIRTQKPKMAVCVYHDLRHLYEVPLYLKSLAPDYKIYFRHHTMYEYETICYATV